MSAWDVLSAAGCTTLTRDFHTSAQVDVILAEADRVHYRKPRNANGSRGRYFYQRLQRQAQKERQ